MKKHEKKIINEQLNHDSLYCKLYCNSSASNFLLFTFSLYFYLGFDVNKKKKQQQITNNQRKKKIFSHNTTKICSVKFVSLFFWY